MRTDKPRDPVAGPDEGPEAPYPVRLSGPVIKGFGRGSKDVSFGLVYTDLLHSCAEAMLGHTADSECSMHS